MAFNLRNRNFLKLLDFTPADPALAGTETALNTCWIWLPI